MIEAPKEWKEFEYFDEQWKIRIKKLSELIAEETTILDLGCGKMWLKEYLPEHKVYLACDYIQRATDTIVCDFNKHQFPEVKVDLCFISGCLEYVQDVQWFVGQVGKACNSVIISYCTTDYHPDPQVRNSLGWVNSLTSDEIIKLFSELGFLLQKRDVVCNNEIFKFSSRGTVNE